MAAFCARITGGRTCLPVSVSLDFQCNNLSNVLHIGEPDAGRGDLSHRRQLKRKMQQFT